MVHEFETTVTFMSSLEDEYEARGEIEEMLAEIAFDWTNLQRVN